MNVYAVDMPIGTKDDEYRTYVELLKKKGIDVSRMTRVPELGSERRWLHVWDSREAAESFAKELQDQTGNPDWFVREIQDGRNGSPLTGPIIILAEPGADGVAYQLTPAAVEQIQQSFPGVRPVKRLFVSEENQDALTRAVGHPWNQIAVLLTGLSEEQLKQLGGFQIYDPAQKILTWAEPWFPPVNREPVSSRIAAWIDQQTTEDGKVPVVIKYLIELTLPNPPWGSEKQVVFPFSGNLEGQFWPWNRAGSRFLEKGKPDAAADVWAASYLAFLALQEQYRFRTHKGMPLCNLGIAFFRASQPKLAKLSWMLGLIEDVLTNPETCLETQNCKNLRTLQVAESNLRQFVNTVENRFVEGGITLLFPELALAVCNQRAGQSPEESHLGSVSRLVRHLLETYPGLPAVEKPAAFIREFWSTFIPFTSAMTGVLPDEFRTAG